MCKATDSVVSQSPHWRGASHSLRQTRAQALPKQRKDTNVSQSTNSCERHNRASEQGSRALKSQLYASSNTWMKPKEGTALVCPEAREPFREEARHCVLKRGIRFANAPCPYPRQTPKNGPSNDKPLAHACPVFVFPTKLPTDGRPSRPHILRACNA